MARVPPIILRRYLNGGPISARGCLRSRNVRSASNFSSCSAPRPSVRTFHTDTVPPSTDASAPDSTISFRKHLKEEAKKRKADGQGTKKNKADNQALDEWELTVGIEIHAQLNTARKLFSGAASTINEEPNTYVNFFDLSMPGSMPSFQKETLIPAVRAALVLNCDIQHTSRFDRKHYFHWDQPAGYQITQYYQPFAKNGYVTLYARDGIAKEDGEEIRIGIKQVQMEQDTAKTITQPGNIHLLDFNRVGLPLVEIITMPHIHHPSTAAAFVRKVQTLLGSVNACVLGMESGGLRADVNVSVRRRTDGNDSEGHAYAGVTGLGQRTEIKNLSSFKAVDDAIVAERDRQIQLIDAGGKVEGETRGWSIGSSETRRLRGKEGEVDYRYMPDPDLAPVLIGRDLIQHLQSSLGQLPDEEIFDLTDVYGLSEKDAMSLVALDNGARAEYFRLVVARVTDSTADQSVDQKAIGKLCGNWLLHELGGLTSTSAQNASDLQFDAAGNSLLPVEKFAELIVLLYQNKITAKAAKKVLKILFEGACEDNAPMEVRAIIEEGDLWFIPMSEAEYHTLASSIIDQTVLEQILKGEKGKIMFLVGQMMRNGEDGRVDPQKAREVLEQIIEEQRT